MVFAQSIGVGEPFTINTIIYVVQIITVGLSVIFGNKMRRRTNLLVCTIGMLVSLVAVGGLGVTKDSDGNFSRGVGIGIVVFAYFNIVFYNFSIGVSRGIDHRTGSALTLHRRFRTPSHPRWPSVGTEIR